MKRILLLGKNGQVGVALQKVLPSYAALISQDRTTCDLTEPDQIRSTIRAAKPDLIINAAAYTAVDQAETDTITCTKMNAIAPAVIAEEARLLGALLIHYSTDYVFDGSKTGCYSEEDLPNPVNVYGRSKFEGDQAILAAGGIHIILRVAWVYSATGRNFAKTILRLAAERDDLKVVNDQWGSPTSADQIATVTAGIVSQYIASRQPASATVAPRSGIYNLAPSGVTSWYGFASELIAQANQQGMKLRVSSDRIAPIESRDYPTPARRPANSVLSTEKLQRSFDIAPPDWRDGVKTLVAEIAVRPS